MRCREHPRVGKSMCKLLNLERASLVLETEKKLVWPKGSPDRESVRDHKQGEWQREKEKQAPH